MTTTRSCNSTANSASSNGGNEGGSTDSNSLMSFPYESSPSADIMDQNDNKWVSVILNWLHSSHDRPAVQTEALWALTNIAGLVPPSGIMNNAATTAAAAATARSISSKGGVSSNAAPISSWPFSSVNNTKNNILPTNSSNCNNNSLDLSLQGKWERCDKISIDLQQQQQQLIEEKRLLLQGFNDAMNSGMPNSNIDAFMNNAALSNFLEQAALNGVSFDPATLAAAVQLCAATASNTANSNNNSNNNNHWASMLATADAMANRNLNMTTATHNQTNLQFAEASSSFASSAAAAAAAAASSIFPSSLFQLPSHSAAMSTSIHSTLPAAAAAATTAMPMVPEQYLNYSSFSSGVGPCTNALLSHVDALPTLISLLKSPHRQVHEQAMWILGSIVVGGSSSSNNNCSSSTNNSNLSSTTGAAALVDPFYHDNNKNITNNNNKNHHHSSNKESVASSSTSSTNMNNNNNNVAIAREAVLAAGILEPLCTCLNDNAWNISLQRIGSWLLSNLVIPNANANNSNNNNNNNNNNKSNMGTAALSYGATPEITANSFNTILDTLNGDVGGNSSRTGNREGDNLPIKSNPNQESNLSSSSSPGSYFDVQIILPTLRRLLFSGDADVLSHTCWAFSHLCDGPSVHIAAVVCDCTVDGATHMTIPQRLVELLLHPSWRVTKPALRTIGNIVCAECTTVPTSSSTATMDTLLSTTHPSKLAQQLQQQLPQDYTEVVLQSGAVPRLKTFISHSNREIQKEACWTLSNIAAGTISQIQAVMDCGAIPPLVTLASDPSADHEVRSEACWVVLNATSCGSDDQVEQLVADGCVNVLGVLLKEASMVMMALEGLERVLQVEEAREANALLLSNSASSKSTRSMSSAVLGSVVNPTMIESLEQHKNSAVAKRAARIWKQHFVCCALCHQYFSRHRPSEAGFCNECKCHVCSSCNCEIYHLSYQEELWKEAEVKSAQGVPNSNKTSKSKKKKQKKKEKKKQAAIKKDDLAVNKEDLESADAASRSWTCTSVNNKASSNNASNPSDTNKDNKNNNEDGLSKLISKIASHIDEDSINHSSSVSSAGCSDNGSLLLLGVPHVCNQADQQQQQKMTAGDGRMTNPQIEEDETKRIIVHARTESLRGDSADCGTPLQHWEKDCSDPIDFVLYLQQTGSIIALSKLMDALEFD